MKRKTGCSRDAGEI